MKKIFEKHGMLRSVGALMDIVAFLLFIVSIFVDASNADMILKLIGIVLFVVGSMFVAVTSEKSRLAKSLFVFIVTSILLTWLFAYGYFQGSDFYEYGMSRIDFADFGYALYYSVNFILDKIVFLLVLTGFYGVLSKISGYQKLTENIAKTFSKHKIVSSVVISVILFVLTSLFTQTFVVLLFIPFFISILAKMDIDKVTTFAVTFGSALVGILGCTYGTDSLIAFNRYLGQEINVALTYRFIIAVVSLVLYEFFIVMRLRKTLNSTKKKEKNSNLVSDPFEVKNVKEAKTLPVAIVLGIVAIITILGYIDWSTNFNIDVFNTFHDWLINLEAGDEFTIFGYILGSKADALGAFKFVFSISAMLLVASALVAFLYKMKVDEYVDSFFEGNKKMLKPLLFVIASYVIFGICYLTPVIPTIANWFLNLVEGFNPYLTAIMAFITSLFQNDLGYSAYTVGGFLTSAYADNINIVHTIFVSMYGLVQIFMPTSALLVVGLSLMDVDYKDWLKYIWLFVVGLIVILLVLFTVVTYI